MKEKKILDKVYNPRDVEKKWYDFWIDRRLFRADEMDDAPPYSIVIPPPNVTGSLHMGHALNNTLQDILIRMRRMQGYNTLWVPGMDHAGIATQNVVERQLAEEGKGRHDLGREKFIERVWTWREESGGTIIHQLKRLGASCDWSRERFTMDEGLSRAVKEVFYRLYHEGLIYRGDYVINWCPRCHTALSDLEVEHEPLQGNLYHIRYPLKGGGEAIVATTRPETMLGDTAVAVNPSDERYKNLMERYRLHPEYMGWLKSLPQEFLTRFRDDPTEINLYALLGAVVGLTSDLDRCQKDKDWREYSKMQDYKALHEHLVGEGPQDLNLYVTTKCNFKCWFCRRQREKVEDTPDMIPGMIERVLDAFPTIKSACIAGFGEPLMHPHLDQLVATLNDRGIRPSIITNGSLLGKRIDDLAQMDLSFISVSLNESTAEAHARTHGVEMFDQVLEGIRAVVALHKYPVVLGKVVYKQNYRDIPAFLELAQSLGVDSVNFVNLLPHKETLTAEEEKQFWAQVITQEDADVLYKLEEYKKLPGADLVRVWPVPISRDAARCPHACRSPWQSIGVDSHGYYSPCRRIMPPAVRFGHIDNAGLWYGKAYQSMRKSVLGDGPRTKMCEKCFAAWRDY